MAVQCLGSLKRWCASPLQFQIPDDGTLTEEDLASLTEELSPMCIVRRDEADQRMRDLLRRHPHALALRSKLPLALKLFDAVLLGSSERFAFCDSDILFLRPVVDPFVLPDETTNALFIEDREHSYSLRSWQLTFSPGVTLPDRINTGMISLRKKQYDLDLLDWFVGKRMHAGVPTMLEQTAWALLGQRIGCRKFDPRQIRVMRGDEPDDELVAGHFTARTRHLLDHYLAKSQQAPADLEPVQVGTIPSGTCTALSLGLYETRRIVNRISGAFRPARNRAGEL
jgi:hypothetical protein